MLLTVVGMTLLGSAAVGSVWFIVLYHMRTRWWRHDFGRWLMTFVASEALWMWALLLSLLFRHVPDWYRWIETFAFIGVPVTIWWRLVILMRVQQGVPDVDEMD